MSTNPETIWKRNSKKMKHPNNVEYFLIAKMNENGRKEQKKQKINVKNNLPLNPNDKEKKEPKKFSSGNNMDPDEVSEVMKGLTEIEEMLIVQVFTVMTVYQLKEGQNGYRGNIINFPQDVRTFTTQLPRHPSTLNVL